MSQRHNSPRTPAHVPARRRPGHVAPASPWVIDTRELGRRPGTMRRYQRRVPAPAGFGFDGVLAVSEGSDVELDVRVESVVEGVLLTGMATAEVVGECSRCLEPLSDRVSVQFTELFAYPDSATDVSTDPDEVSRVVDDLIDTEPVVRDAILLALPRAPLCTPDCAGLCPECGGRWAELGADHRHETMDPRWAVLAKRYGEVKFGNVKLGNAELGSVEEENK
jgi:uncharacterized protein